MRFFLPLAASVFLLLHAAGASAQAPGMAAAVDRLLAAQPAAAHAHWGISILDATTGASLYAYNDGQLFEPASNAKLFTTATALALLGPTYTMRTRVIAEGTVDAAGTLHGDLRLVGGGDPTISGRVYPYAGKTDRSSLPLAGLDDLAGQVLAHGIHAVDGQVIADDSLFPNDDRYGAGWGWDDLQWEYGAAVSALSINDNVRYLTITPGAAAGTDASTSWLPEMPDPGTSLTGAASTSAPGTEPALGLSRYPDDATLRLYGSLPARGTPAHLALAIHDPARYASEALKAALQTKGVTVTGQASAVHRLLSDTQSFVLETHLPVPLRTLLPGATSSGPPLPGAVVATRTSVALAQIVTVTNKVSQNLHAEILLRLLGHEEGTDGSAAQGARVVRSFLTADAGVAPDDFVLYDGSGLSTKDLLTPRAATALLRYSDAQPWGQVFRDSLPISGVDGSLAARLPELKGRVQAKTGTLGEVDALSGFLTANSGRVVIFSVLCNDFAGTGSRAVVDALVLAAAQTF